MLAGLTGRASLRPSSSGPEASPGPAVPRPTTTTAADTHREINLTRVGIVATLIAALLSIATVAVRLFGQRAVATSPHLLTGLVFLLIVAYLIYGSLVYQLTRLAYLRRLLFHRRPSDDALLRLYRTPRAPSVTVLVPAYKEEVQVVRKTPLSTALQGYPKRRIVLLIDDPPQPASPHDLASLSALRRLPEELDGLLRGPRGQCTAALAAFCERRIGPPLDLPRERRRLARLHRELRAWFQTQAARHPIADHVDGLFVDLIYRGQARPFVWWP